MPATRKISNCTALVFGTRAPSGDAKSLIYIILSLSIFVIQVSHFKSVDTNIICLTNHRMFTSYRIVVVVQCDLGLSNQFFGSFCYFIRDYDGHNVIALGRNRIPKFRSCAQLLKQSREKIESFWACVVVCKTTSVIAAVITYYNSLTNLQQSYNLLLIYVVKKFMLALGKLKDAGCDLGKEKYIRV